MFIEIYLYQNVNVYNVSTDLPLTQNDSKQHNSFMQSS